MLAEVTRKQTKGCSIMARNLRCLSPRFHLHNRPDLKSWSRRKKYCFCDQSWFLRARPRSYIHPILQKIGPALRILVTYNHCRSTRQKRKLRSYVTIYNNMENNKCLSNAVASGGYTYYVPTIRLVVSSIWSTPTILAMPKSEIFAFIEASSRTLLALRSLWMILNLESWWRYRIPRATPQIMLKRIGQSNCDLLVSSGINN